jgi:ADP-heptose:LPS heptosyltransferase
MRKFLIINPFGIGDALFSMVLAESLRKAHPGCRIGFVCNERTFPLVRMNSTIDEVYIFNRDRFRGLQKKDPVLPYKKLAKLLSAIKKSKYDTLFDLSLGREFSFYGYLIGIKKRLGLDFKGRGLFLTEKIKIDGYTNRHVIDYQLDLLEMAGIPSKRSSARLPLSISDAALKRAELLFLSAGFKHDDAILAVAPGGGKSWGKNALYKQWEPENFSETVNRLSQAKSYKVMIIGDSDESAILAKTASGILAPQILVVGETLETVCALLKKTNILLCNDGGLLHLANALGVKTAAIFGPVDQVVYGPYGDSPKHLTFTEPVPCRPCYQKFHFPPCKFDRQCLKKITVDRVASAMKEFACQS